MQAVALLEITGGVVRIFENGGNFGEPFDLSMFIIGDEGVATIKGARADQQLKPYHVKIVAKALAQHGFHEMVWHRHKGNTKVEVRIRFDLEGKCTFVRPNQPPALP